VHGATGFSWQVPLAPGGAIAVLFLFVIMMINIKLSDILDVGSQYTKNFPLAFTVGSLFVYEIFSIVPVNYNKVFILNLPIDLLNYFNGLLFGSTGTSVDAVNVTQNPCRGKTPSCRGRRFYFL
jgi:NADH-ubiquinone oxidoreductase chain 6